MQLRIGCGILIWLDIANARLMPDHGQVVVLVYSCCDWLEPEQLLLSCQICVLLDDLRWQLYLGLFLGARPITAAVISTSHVACSVIERCRSSDR